MPTPVIPGPQHPTGPQRRVLPSTTAKNFLAAVQVPKNLHVGCIENPPQQSNRQQLPAMSAAGKGRSKRFAEFEEKIVKGQWTLYPNHQRMANGIADFDIENEAPDSDAESGSEESADENAGTEHYVAVGYATTLSAVHGPSV